MAENNEYKSLYDCKEADELVEANVCVDGRKSRIPMQHVMAMPSFMMSHDYLDAKEGQHLGQIVIYYPKDSHEGLETGKNLRVYGNLRKIESPPYKGFYLILDKVEILD